jgi:hypothetical protein
LKRTAVCTKRTSDWFFDIIISRMFKQSLAEFLRAEDIHRMSQAILFEFPSLERWLQSSGLYRDPEAALAQSFPVWPSKSEYQWSIHSWIIHFWIHCHDVRATIPERVSLPKVVHWFLSSPLNESRANIIDFSPVFIHFQPSKTIEISDFQYISCLNHQIPVKSSWKAD